MVLKNFIVFEGIDGAGTSTQIKRMREKTKGNDAFLFTAEPTSCETGKFLRKMLKGEVPLQNESAAYLFAADRNEHVNGTFNADGATLITGIKKACENGKTVISDRYLFSSLAYQSIQCDPNVPRLLNSLFPLPELLFYFDITPEISLARLGGREYREIYENTQFLQKTVAEYKKIIAEYASPEKNEGMRIVTIDATIPPDEVESLLWKEICR